MVNIRAREALDPMPSKTLTAVPATRLPAEPMKPVIDPAAWTGKQLAQESGWQFKLTDVEITEIDQAVASVKDHGLDIKDITLADFPLPTLDAKLAEIKTQVLEGRGVALLRGIPVHRYDIAESAAAYWGIGLRIGNPVSQNHHGHLLGHVYDLVGPSREAPSTRAYHTSAYLNYHSDSCDAVCLLCLQPAKDGGMSSVASSVAIYNEMLRRRPDLVAELVKPWFRDRRNEIPPGKDPWFELPVFCFAEGYFSCSWHNYYIRSTQRFDELPRFTEAQIEALDMMDTLADELKHETDFRPGDIQFLHNHVIVHGRTKYEDWPEPERKRHLLRLWLETPGGRPLPDAVLERYVGLKPGQRPAGIIVESMELTTPLDPE
jgi:hypothetical protein